MCSITNEHSSFDGNEYVPIQPSKYSHKRTYGLANYNGRALTSGCLPNGDPECHFKTEVLDMETMTWSEQPDYPVESVIVPAISSKNYLAAYSTVSISDAAYIIGGVYTKDIVSEFRNWKWRKLDNLKTGRSAHGSFAIGNRAFVIGGSGYTGYPDHKWEM